MLVPWALAGVVLVALFARGLSHLRDGRREEGRTYVLTGLAIGLGLGVFTQLPRPWLGPIVFAGETAVAVVEAWVAASWTVRRRQVGRVLYRLEGDSTRWQLLVLVSLGSALGAVSNLLGVGQWLHAVPLIAIAVSSIVLAGLEAKIGTRVTSEGFLQGVRFTPWTKVVGAQKDGSTLLVLTARRFDRWLGHGWRRVHGDPRGLDEVLDHVHRLALRDSAAG